VVDRPFFSILLPTKNRSHLVGYAIRSVLLQDFADFEIVVCDNDDDASSTRLVVEGFLGDARIRYLRTGDLDMVQNWTRALNASRGRNVILLEDKMVFYPGALASIRERVNRSPSGVVVWRTDVVEDASAKAFLIQIPDSGERIMRSEEVLSVMSRDVMKLWQYLPRGLCCCTPAELIYSIQEKTGEPYYEIYSPDFVAAVKLLANIDEYLLWDRSLQLVVSSRVGNGRNVSSKRDTDCSYYKGKSPLVIKSDYVDVKNPLIVANSIANDFRRQTSKYGGRLLGYPIAQADYVRMMVKELAKEVLRTRRVTWMVKDFFQLIMSGRSPLHNFVIMVGTAVGLLWRVACKKNLPEGGARRPVRRILTVDGDPMDVVQAFLDGRATLGIVQPFTTGAAVPGKKGIL